jgi:hypothetical protein
LKALAPLVVGLLGVHALLKFAFFLLPYATRRRALDKSYGTSPTATRTSDTVLLVIVVAVAVLLYVRGVDGASFLGGLWIGATLIQVYFHRFHAPLGADRQPPAVDSPIKTMSYAIQDAPWRPWREIALLAVLIIGSIVIMIRE